MKYVNTNTNMFLASIITILWWASIWYLIEETMVYVSGNKKHFKAFICMIIIIGITMYSFLNPDHSITL